LFDIHPEICVSSCVIVVSKSNIHTCQFFANIKVSRLRIRKLEISATQPESVLGGIIAGSRSGSFLDDKAGSPFTARVLINPVRPFTPSTQGTMSNVWRKYTFQWYITYWCVIPNCNNLQGETFE
jgi:hypothetical protein